MVRAPLPIHGKTSTVEHNGKGVFAGLTSAFQAGRYHSLVVDEKTLPGDLESRAHESDGLVMGLRHRRCPFTACSFTPNRC